MIKKVAHTYTWGGGGVDFILKNSILRTMNWTVDITKKVSKAIPKLPKSVRRSLFVLLREIELSGPARGNWRNYGKLSNNLYHCHIKKGNPTYVVVWEISDKKIKIVEVTYVGTHEKSPY